MQLNRRELFGIAGAGLIAAGAGRLQAQRKIPVALELYSIREECKKDWPGSLAAVAKMGYEGVEFAGYNDWSAKDLKKLLSDNGLKACSAHVGYQLFSPEKFESTVDFHQELGVKQLIIPGFRSETAAGWRKFADELSENSAKLAKLGMRTGYHNHAHEMTPIDGQVPWEIVFDNTPKEVIHQADVGHMLRAGVDPASYIKKYAGRTATTHAKDFNPDKEDILLGEGKMDWKSVLGACMGVGATEWYIVEQEVYPVSPLEASRQSLVNFKKILAES